MVYGKVTVVFVYGETGSSVLVIAFWRVGFIVGGDYTTNPHCLGISLDGSRIFGGVV